ncbi:MAG: hypothetical protein Q3Y13_09825, partial [Sutterella sp.]|nr:hypothetical protein [Sutterella sp.]
GLLTFMRRDLHNGPLPPIIGSRESPQGEACFSESRQIPHYSDSYDMHIAEGTASSWAICGGKLAVDHIVSQKK